MSMLARGLPRDRFEVEVAALTRLGPLEGELVDAGIHIHSIRKRLKFDPFAVARLARLMRTRRFDAVLTWIFAANVHGRLAARRARVPIVLTSEMAVDLWKGRAQLEIDRRLAGWTDRVIGNSRAVVDFYRKHGIPDDRLACILSGIGDEEPPDVDRAAVRAACGTPPDATVAIFIGRLAPQKAVEELLAAIDVLQHIRPNLHTWIVGDGPERERLEGIAHAFHLGAHVRFCGHRDDVPRLLAAADLLVLPSLYEGLPNVVLEAMRFRKPVVATAAPGTTEVVADHRTGLLVPPGNKTELARAILRIVDDPTLAHRLGAAGRDLAESAFHATVMIERFARLIEDLARSKGITLDVSVRDN